MHDPISGSTAVLQEYGYGNRLITVRGNATAIADYEKGELIEIDRDAGTYSITKFETIAKLASRAGGAGTRTAAVRSKPEVRNAVAVATKSGRAAEFFEANLENQRVTIGVDRSVKLSREALEVLIGSAYPSVRLAEHDVVLTAASSGRLPIAAQSAGSASSEAFGLPLEQVVKYDIEGQQVEFRSSVLRVGNEPPPAEALGIPAGARQVESRSAAVTRELDFIDNPTATPPRNQQ